MVESPETAEDDNDDRKDGPHNEKEDATSTSDHSKETNVESEQKERTNEKGELKKRRNMPWWKRRRENIVDGQETTTDFLAQEESAPHDIQNPPPNSTTTTTTTTTTSDANATTTATTVPTQQQQHPTGIIIATPIQPYRYGYRRGGPPASMTNAHTNYQQQQQQHPSPNTLVLAELATSIVSTVARVWFLTWLTRRLASQEESMDPTQQYVWERLHDRYQRDTTALANAMQTPPAGVSMGQWRRHGQQQQRNRRNKRAYNKSDIATLFTRTVLVVEICSDTDQPQQQHLKGGVDLEQLAHVVSFLLQQHRLGAFGTHRDTGTRLPVEVVFLVQSPGGSVAAFGLAAAHMRRLSETIGITTTVCVDKYAASGGYMIASQAHKLIAAPFATLGSIGVILEGLNFNQLVTKYGVQPIVLKAGALKNPISTFGEITRHDMRQEEQRLAVVHESFKQLVLEGRPGLADSIAKIADGSVFLGREALSLHMVDEVLTSEEYLLDRVFAGDRVLKLHRSHQARMPRGLRSLSPLDLLPHLKSWVQQNVLQGSSSLGGDYHPAPFWTATRLLQMGSLFGFAQHLVQSFVKENGKT
jgi:signal peptide peptidase SppA